MEGSRAKATQKAVAELEQNIRNHPAFDKPYQWSPKDFELGTLLGQGQFGKVHVAREKQTGYLFAIKTLFKSKIAKEKIEHFVVREIEIQSHLKHPNILRMFTWFHDESRIYIVLEYVGGGSLKELRHKSPNRRFPDDKAALYIYQVADALAYCHSMQVIHRDIKLENILVDIDGNLKLADFGLSAHAPSNRRKTACGTICYLPPEIVVRQEYDNAVDLWSLGVLLYECVVGKPPFRGATVDETYENILDGVVTYPKFVSVGAKSLISRLLKQRAQDRLSIEGVKKHFWVQKYIKKKQATSADSSEPSTSSQK